jgi:hypothetical protein
MSLRTLPLIAALALGGCSLPAQTPLQYASLPNDAIAGAGDPLRTAATNTGFVFSAPAELAGRPASAARALAQMEYLAVEVPSNPRLTNVTGTVTTDLADARREWRTALGIAPGVAAQPVIDGLYAAARALSGGMPDAAAAALPTAIFQQGGQATLTRLAALPSLPLTNKAAVGAAEILRQQENTARGKL